MKIFLDDIRTPPSGWKRTYTANGTIYLIKIGQVTHLSLDHDLGDERYSGTGYDVMLYLEERARMDPSFHMPDVKFHTSNPIGRKRMEQCLSSTLKFLDNLGSQGSSYKARNHRRDKLVRNCNNGSK